MNECIILNNVHQIVNKETVFQTGKIMSLNIKRYHKYKRNGFVFTNKDNLTYHDIITKYDRHKAYCKHEMSYTNILSKNKNYIYENIFKYNKYNNYDTVEKFLGHDIMYVKPISSDQYKCITDECIIYFIDSKMKHIHYNNGIMLD